MAIVVSSAGYEEKSRRSSFRAERKPWMLSDYLRDDMSSCSSNGFRSFPRKQCCVAVKNMIENETFRNNRTPKPPKKLVARRKQRTVSSALQRASTALINAVKLLPFTSAVTSNNNSSSNGGSGRRFLPRSFSKKLFKRSFFWKKQKADSDLVASECDEIERWISSGVVATEIYQPLDLSNDTSVTNSNSTEGKNSNSDCWSEITFTTTTSDYLGSLSENDVVKREEVVISKSSGVVVGQDSSNDSAIIKNAWCNEEAETEHLSPISVMDFPYNDEGSASPFTRRESRLKGTKERLMEKLGRFESLAVGLGLDPVNLESLMSSTEIEDRSPKHSIQSCSTPSFILSGESESEEEEEDESQEDEEDEEEKRVQHLLNIIKLKMSNYNFGCDNLLLSFLRENVGHKVDISLLKSAEDWLDGRYDTLILGWEVKDKRQAYIRDMEERGRWPKDCKLEQEEIANELGDEVLTTLIQEVILEL